MDGTRFDDFARGFAYRLTRRRALSGGAGLTAALLGVRGIRESAASNIALHRYSSVQHYTTSATASQVKGALADLLPQLQKIAGFIDYSIINASGDHILSVAVFSTSDGIAQAQKLEAQWVKAHATALNSAGKAESGPVILHGATGAGCPCDTSTANSCNNDTLTCCGTTDAAGGPGTCVDASIGCGEPSPTCVDDGAACPAGCADGAACDGCCSGACTSDGACGAAACKAPGDPCQMVPNHGCCPGYTCFEGVCDNPRGCFGPGDPCSSNSDCCEGSCSDSGTCYCTDPSRPAIGCSCDPTDTNACGGRPDLCCTGTCISPMAECMPPQACDGPGTPCTVGNDNCCQGYTCFEGICDNPKGCAGAGATCSNASDCCEGDCSDIGVCFCTDPDRPDIGCSCDPSEPNACGGRPDLCCAGHCISPMANCS